MADIVGVSRGGVNNRPVTTQRVNVFNRTHAQDYNFTVVQLFVIGSVNVAI